MIERLQRPWRRSALPFLALTILAVGGCTGSTPEDAEESSAVAEAAEEASVAELPRGLVTREEGVSAGFLMFTPLLSDTTYLMDNEGQIVHLWKSEFAPSGGVYLLDSGNIIRGARIPDVEVFQGGGQGGRIQEITWDGEVVWEFDFASDQHLLHHDIEILPNGNILAIAWEAKTADQVVAVGGNPATTPPSGRWPDMIIEIEPQRPSGGRVVWEWRAWDHLVQNLDDTLPSYGDPSAHPGRIDINATGAPPEISSEELEQLKALGYVPPDAEPEDLGSDMFHTNAIDYNAELDQIALSTPRYHEIWIIDHSTTTAEAAGSTGGRWGRGGDLLFRWGNPAMYGRGSVDDQQLFGQHDVRWIPDGFPGAGNLMIFNNDVPAEDGNYSRVVEIDTPMGASGYDLSEGEPFEPAEPVWAYSAAAATPFYSPFISGATRLANGNTLICSGAPGRFFEVTADGRIVWDYRDAHSGDVRMPDGSTPHPVGEFTYAVFRITRISADDPALAGKTLQPLDPQPPLAGEAGGGS